MGATVPCECHRLAVTLVYIRAVRIGGMSAFSRNPVLAAASRALGQPGGRLEPGGERTITLTGARAEDVEVRAR